MHEVRRTQYTLQRLSWYHQNKYNAFLPKHLHLDETPIDASVIFCAISSEYNEATYLIQMNYIQANWIKIKNVSGVDLQELLPWLVPEYCVQLTRYGVGGSYHFPNSIIANIQVRRGFGALQNIFHEMTHLGIHPGVETYNIPHWVKERLVDNLTAKLNPTYSRVQNIPSSIDTNRIDAIFNMHYPNTKRIIYELHSTKDFH